LGWRGERILIRDLLLGLIPRLLLGVSASISHCVPPGASLPPGFGAAALLPGCFWTKDGPVAPGSPGLRQAGGRSAWARLSVQCAAAGVPSVCSEQLWFSVKLTDALTR